MDLKFTKWPLSGLTGIMAFILFTLFTLTSAALFPVPYNPIYMWLSNLGNVNLNPTGAAFFNWGCIITGVTLIPFFLGLYQWKPAANWSRILLIVGMILGVLASISLIMVGIFPETHIKEHVMAAAGVFGSLFIILILINIALYNHPQFKRWIAYYAIIAILIDLSFKYILSIYKDILAVFNPTMPAPGMEWASVFASLAWVLFLAINMLKLGKK